MTHTRISSRKSVDGLMDGFLWKTKHCQFCIKKSNKGMNRDHFKRLINSFIPIYSCITNKSERKYHLQQVSSEMSSFEKRLQGFLGCSKN